MINQFDSVKYHFDRALEAARETIEAFQKEVDSYKSNMTLQKYLPQLTYTDLLGMPLEKCSDATALHDLLSNWTTRVTDPQTLIEKTNKNIRENNNQVYEFLTKMLENAGIPMEESVMKRNKRVSQPTDFRKKFDEECEGVTGNKNNCYSSISESSVRSRLADIERENRTKAAKAIEDAKQTERLRFAATTAVLIGADPGLNPEMLFELFLQWCHSNGSYERNLFYYLKWKRSTSDDVKTACEAILFEEPKGVEGSIAILPDTIVLDSFSELLRKSCKYLTIYNSFYKHGMIS